jgi:hypothetical protein
MRFLFAPPATHAVGLLDLPWREPLADWVDERLVEVRQAGVHRHVVRFVADGDELYALKELDESLARSEYRVLRRLAEQGIPAVEVQGVVVDRGAGLDAVLVTKFLSFSLTYRWLFANPRRHEAADLLLDALVELLVRLHLAGCFWGDCSLSNTLFRPDAGTLAAYLVDAETAELRPRLSDGQRSYDIELAKERVVGELFDLESGDLLPSGVDPLGFAGMLEARYEALWDALTGEETVAPDEQRYRIAERIRRLNQLGFDVAEVELVAAEDEGEGAKVAGNRVRLRTQLSEPGHHRRKLLARTGLDVQENQARRLLNDIASFRAYLEQKEGHKLPTALVASRWLAEVYDPVVAAIPEGLRDRLEPAEIFHEILDHRWFLSEAAGRDVGTTAAARSYFATVLPSVPGASRAVVDDESAL